MGIGNSIQIYIRSLDMFLKVSIESLLNMCPGPVWALSPFWPWPTGPWAHLGPGPLLVCALDPYGIHNSIKNIIPGP